MKLPTLETDRLILRPLTLADADPAQPLFAQWEIVRHLVDRVPWPFPDDGCFTFYRDVALPEMEQGEAWHWSIRLRNEDETFIGAISLYRRDGDNRGFWLGLPWQGQGLMAEASAAVTDYWFDVLGQSVMRIPKAAANKASRRISERVGMRLITTEIRSYVEGALPAEIWEITADEWRAYRAKA